MYEALKAVPGLLVTRAGSGVAQFWVKILKSSFSSSLTLVKLLNISKASVPCKIRLAVVDLWMCVCVCVQTSHVKCFTHYAWCETFKPTNTKTINDNNKTW